MTDGDRRTLPETTDDEALERTYVEGYQQKPENSSVGKLGEKMAREVWPQESWEETA